VLPSRGVTWSAETEDVIVGRFELSPEHPEVHARIDGRGALVTVSALRWGNAGEQTFRYIRCGVRGTRRATLRRPPGPQQLDRRLVL
jgi:hypothetical protein